MNKDILSIKVKVKKIIFYNKDNSYYIISSIYDNEELVVIGTLDNIEEDYNYEIKGEYVEHARYGKQFKAYHAKIILPTKEELVITYLAGKQFKGIGKSTAKKICEVYAKADNLLDEIINNSELLYNIKGLKKENADNLVNILISNNTENILFTYLKEYNIDYASTLNIFTKTNIRMDEFVNILQTNPYLLMKYHISYKVIDKIAIMLKLDNYDILSKAGLVYSTIKELTFKMGATYLTKNQILEKVRKDIIDLDSILDNLVNDKLIVLKDDMVYEYQEYQEEAFIADFIKDYSKIKEDNDIEDYLNEYQSYHGISFNEEQLQGINNGINTPISIITGGPGTGKSTVVAALMHILNLVHQDCFIGLCAPTGKASKRLAQLTNKPAMTIHRLLKYDMLTDSFDHNIYNPLRYDVLIIDEASMIDNLLMGSLLKASFNVKKIIILGDYNQLPSVSQGQVLKDLIDSKKIATTFLNKIYRQKDGSSIIELAYQVLNHHKLTNNIIKDDLKIIDINDEYNIKKLLVYYAKNYKDIDMQILSPLYRGTYGINNLNKYIQKIKYDDKFEAFNKDDLVLQLKNRHMDDIYNGEVGVIKKIKDKITVSFETKDIEYTNKEKEELALAYTISIHKAQGNEYDEIILFLPSSAGFFINNKILYTAITRPKKKLWIVSDLYTLNKAISSDSINTRQTRLKDLLIK